mgnify:CR=1 FL=1|jgi:hypothetical protein
MKKFIILFVCLVAIATGTHAQRLIPGQRGLQLSVGVPITENKLFENGNFVCEMAMTINHKRANYWLFGLEYAKKNFTYRESKIPSETVAFEGGYLLNLFSDAGKNVLLNTGITAVAGYETVNRGEKLLPDGATLLTKDRFVYGGAYHLALDVFATDNLVLFAKVKCNVLWGSDVEKFRPSLQTGIKIIF